MGWQGWSREFGQHAARLHNGRRLQAQTRPASAMTLRAEPGHKQSIRTVCAWRRPEPLALAHAREEEQRGQRAAARFNRVRSALTQQVNAVVATKVRFHAVFPAEESGQLRFLG